MKFCSHMAAFLYGFMKLVFHITEIYTFAFTYCRCFHKSLG